MDISVFLFTHFDENCCSKYGMPKHDDLIERSGDLSASAEPETKKLVQANLIIPNSR